MMPRNIRTPYEHEAVPLPKNIKDIPRYLKAAIGGFFTRFAYIVKLVWNTGHWILFLLTFMAAFKGIMPLIGTLLSKNILNELQMIIQVGAAPTEQFWNSPVFFLIIFLFVYQILQRIITNLSHSFNRMAGEKVSQQVRVQMMEKSKYLDLASFDDPQFYERMENANREAGMRPLTILTETFGIVSTLIELISYLVILFSVPDLVWATALILAISLPSAIVNFIFRKKNFKYFRHRSKERRQMTYFSQLLVNKDLIKEARLYDLGDTFIEKFMGAFRTYYRGLRNLILQESIWHVVIGIAAGLANFIFYILVAIKVFAGQIMIGDYTLYTSAAAAAAAGINTLISSSGTIYEGTLFVDNLIAFMKEKQTILPTISPAHSVAKSNGHTIEFRNVSFSYPGSQKNVLKNISFTIHAGETIALVGLNGAGKTTLIKLLTRLYDPTAGVILLDGRDIREYDLGSLYQAFGIIFQDFGKYAVSVAENIHYGDIHKERNIERVRNAAEQSAASEYIGKLPNGYDTPLMRIFETNGTELSIGQWQKLAVARAFYADAEILILDEPTASLDAIAEQEIFQQFDRLREGKTTIFVSHRLSSATTANKILVLKDGMVVEQGPHQDLMDLGGEYYRLFHTQAKRYQMTEHRELPHRP